MVSRSLLQVKELSTQFNTESGVVRAVDHVSFSLEAGETLGLVGESGCGKSVTALSIMRLVPDPPGRIVDGEVLLSGRDLLSLSSDEMRKVRGREIGMIFQEPMTSLNPVFTIGRQLTEPLRIHLRMSQRVAWDRATELLSMVGIPDAKQKLDAYPHQMSGGQRQRVMIAMAISCNPKLLIADEATTALDVTIQAQILELLVRLKEEVGTALIIITHNLGIVARYADRVNVMYAGRIRESALSEDIYFRPRHPYTVGLLRSVPKLEGPRQQRLESIQGEIPDLLNLPPGCAYGPRCPWKQGHCELDDPAMESVGERHSSACFEWKNLATVDTGMQL